MNLRNTALALALLVCASPLASGQEAEPRYPRKLAAQLVSSHALKEVTRAEGEIEDATPGRLIQSQPIPLGDVGMPTTRKVRVLQTPTNWEMPPFAEVAPPPDGGGVTPPETNTGPRPPALSDIPVPSAPVYSVRMRPRPLLATGPIPAEDMEIPPAFSQARYASPARGIFQLSLYAGTTSFAAEQAFAALRNAVPKREPLEGLGQEAFLGHLEPEQNKPAPPVSHFDSLAPQGDARPDLLDPGVSAARDAPSFQEIPTRVGTPDKLHLPPLVAPEPKASLGPSPSYVTLVVYMPKKALTVELVADVRLATPQDLIEMAMHIESRLAELH